METAIETYGIKDSLKRLQMHSSLLKVSQINLVKGLTRHFRKHRSLSEKQLKLVDELNRYIGDKFPME